MRNLLEKEWKLLEKLIKNESIKESDILPYLIETLANCIKQLGIEVKLQ